MIENTNTFNIINGLAIFTKICSKTKILSHIGAIDVILINNSYTQEEIEVLEQFGWEQLSDISWRYWIERKPNSWIELDEEVGRYYDEEYEIVEELELCKYD
jgi:hypothetical protein